ncbi:glycosyltransferase family 4 protein [Hyphomicrobium sp. 99]|uniref:glycosyltransferase family 4 protein n=1 Tax=Hyphomicrobium sp. 99 TaxID=1163419 RepID=UPI001FDAB744|nr:glycosyltransferase family 4 protein [Hyphomicrobium sp. 99]
MRIALLFRSYGPYHLARLNALRQRHSVLALEYSDFDGDYGWDERERKRDAGVIALSQTKSAAEPRTRVTKKLAAELERFRPDAVAIPGYSEAFALAALRICNALGIPTVLMSDSYAGSAGGKFGRETLKRQLMPLYQSAFVAGSPHAEYLSALGFPAEKITTGFDVVDNRHFAKRDATGDVYTRQKRRNVPQAYFFCCARFIAKKNLPFLVEAFARYRCRQLNDAWDLVLAGDGPLRQGIARRASELSVESSVHILGHRSYADLPDLYASAGACILPSITDEWGLVVNEAMAAGLPVLVSKGAGSHRDLVQSGVNGYVFDPKNADELAGLMVIIATSTKRTEMGAASRRIIAGWDIDRFAEGLTRAAEIARASRYGQRSHIGTAVATALSLRI